MSSAPKNNEAPTRTWRTLGLRLAIWYVVVTLGSYMALAAILPLTVRSLADSEGQRTTESALGRYKSIVEAGGTDALRAIFDCHGDPQSSVAVRLSDERNVEIFRGSTDDASGHVAADLSESGATHLASRRAPMGWHVASSSVSQGRQLEVVLHDDAGSRMWSHARTASLWMLACGLAFAVLGALVITRRALAPIDDFANATRGIVDSGDLSLRVRTRGTTDGLDRLAALFNRMLARNEALVRAMKESLDNVAHDLRTPLTRLRAGAELALRGSGDAASTREALAGAIEESDRVLAMLTTLMDITEAETGAMKLDKRTEDLSDIAREAIELYDLVSSERGVHIVTRLSPGVLVSVDRTRIRQACANLMDNAIKYTSSGGRVEVVVTARDGVGVLEVADTGIGIAADEMPRVWDRLYRGDRSRTERGLGLGLALVKAIVEAHGGSVAVRSEPNVGSTFELRFALA
jgi:signal transduction histidine kinase